MQHVVFRKLAVIFEGNFADSHQLSTRRQSYVAFIPECNSSAVSDLARRRTSQSRARQFMESLKRDHIGDSNGEVHLEFAYIEFYSGAYLHLAS